MEDISEGDMNDTLATFMNKKRGKGTMKVVARKRTKKGRGKMVQEEDVTPLESLPPAMEDHNVFDVSPGITVSLFGYSVDNHFRATDTMCRLSGEPESDNVERRGIDRFSSSVTFLREWRNFNYRPRVLRFACQNEDRPLMKDVTLPQFSAATVPQNQSRELNGSITPPESRTDFVMCVGGLVWAMDWCPRVRNKSDSHIKLEFIAVAAHPPESSYHKIGSPLVGRGLIQIWSHLNASAEDEDASQWEKKPINKSCIKQAMKPKSSEPKKPRGRPRKDPLDVSEPKKPRGRPRKYPVDVLKPKNPKGRPRKNPILVTVDDSNDDCEYVQALAVQLPENPSTLLPKDTVSMDTDKNSIRLSARKNKGHHPGLVADNVSTSSLKNRKLKEKATRASVSCGESSPLLKDNKSTAQEFTFEGSTVDILKPCSSECKASESLIPKDVALPRVVLCLAHNGKVAWDVKWRPSTVDDTEVKHRMGYLAVLLGNGALEVWEVPTLQTVQALYSAQQKEGTDPRFLKLKPVFRCSKLKSGDRQSIPLTMEWSASAPHDLILAGCHDGTVALWKFSANHTSEDTRPLLCFTADMVPIRAVAWAPNQSDSESANVIVTAGHKGLKFWDIRDPFRPLWDLNPTLRNIYSLDWLRDPGCVMISFDDGSLRVLSLENAAYDVPATGEPFAGTQYQGLYGIYCSSFAIWSIQISPVTGKVAYCSADGTVLHFQLTHKLVGNKEPRWSRVPHFLCGSLSEENSVITVMSPLPNTPFPRRTKKQMEKGYTSDAQTLAVCYGDDPGRGYESEDLMSSQKTKQMKQPKENIKEKVNFDLALVCRDEDPLDSLAGEDRGKEKIRDYRFDTLPLKLVAMHKVRWNMNKGSARWLCSGGAAGIVRCQEIR